MEGCTGRQTDTHKGALLWGPSFPLHQIFDFTLGRKREADTVRYTDASMTTCTTGPIPSADRSPPTHTHSQGRPPQDPHQPEILQLPPPPRPSSLLEHRSALGPKHLWGSCGRSLEPMSRVGKPRPCGDVHGQRPSVQCPRAKTKILFPFSIRRLSKS